MKKPFLICAFTICACLLSHATIICTFFTITIDSNEIAPIDIDGDGTNDFLLHAEYSPYVNNYITGVSGNEIEVRSSVGVEARRARRIESGDPVGAIAWNDTAYMIENGQGAFSGGEEEYGHVGLRLSKNGTYYYGFIEVRAPYWQASVEVFSKGYNDEALAQTRTDACPHPVGIAEELLPEANAFIAGNRLHVSLLSGEITTGSKVQLFNITGQVVYTETLQQEKSILPLNNIPGGIYTVAILQDEKIVQRKKVLIL